MNEKGHVLISSDLYEHLRARAYGIIVDRMIRDEINPTIEECLEPCIYAAYLWLSNHVDGYRELDSDSMIDEVVDSFRQNSPNAVLERTCDNSYTIRFPHTYWTLFQLIDNYLTDETCIRITYQRQTLRGFVPSNKSAEMLGYIDSLIPDIRKMISDLILGVHKQLLVFQLQSTVAEARKKPRSK
jgi:hypothetical protein